MSGDMPSDLDIDPVHATDDDTTSNLESQAPDYDMPSNLPSNVVPGTLLMVTRPQILTVTKVTPSDLDRDSAAPWW